MKRLLIILLLSVITFTMGCGVVTEQDVDAEVIRQKQNIDESLENIEEDYKGYVENMGIDVDAALEESDN